MKDTLAFHIVYLSKKFYAYANEGLKEHQLHQGQLPFILYIGKHDQCSPAELTKALRMDWGHTQRSITKLVEQGLVLKYYQKDNKRNYHLTLTAQGHKVFTFAHELFQTWDEQCLSSLTTEEKAMMLNLLKKVNQPK